MVFEMNPDEDSWHAYAACSSVDIPFDGLPYFRSTEQARKNPMVLTAKKVCATCVVLEPCRREVEETPRDDRNFGSVQGGYVVGQNGALFDLRQ